MNSVYNDKSIDAVLSRLETKIDRISEDISEIKSDKKSISARVAALEYFRYYLAGIVVACSIFGSLILNKIKTFFN